MRPCLTAALALCLSLPLTPVSAGEDTSRVGTPELVGKCAYVGVTTLNGRIQFEFGGSVESFSTDPTRQPQATQARCTLISEFQSGVPGSEPTYTQATSIALAGAVAPTPPAMTVPLQLRPVQICVDGFGVYGPNTEGNPKNLVFTCTRNLLRSADSERGGGGGIGFATQIVGAILATTMCIDVDDLVVCWGRR